MKSSAIAIAAVCLTAASVVAFLAWPGYMTFDSVFALQQARDGIVNGGYPPMISYLWRLLELVVPGQGGMFFLQLLAVFGGVLGCVWWISRSASAVLVAALLVPVLSATGGPLLVVWKDVLFGGTALLALLASHAWSRRADSRWPIAAAVFALLVFAACLRINGLPALLPGFYLLAAGRDRTQGWRPSVPRLSRFGALTLGAAAFVVIVSVWRLPDLQRVPSQSSQRYGQFHDLLGISACMGVQVFDTSISHGRSLDAAALRHVYFPEHVQKSFGPDGLKEAGLKRITASQWLREVRNHPSCYAWHKLRLVTHMLGFNSGPVFYVTDPGVYPNDMGLAHPVQSRVRILLKPVIGGQASAGARVGVLSLVALLLAGLCRWRFGRWGFPGMLLVASAFYFGASALVYPAADLRYQYFEALVAVVVLVGCAACLVKRQAPP